MPPTLPRPSLLHSATCLSRPSPHHHLPLQQPLQVRHATLIRRPHRPYTFTQIITLSDGSTFLHRTTSPSPVYKSTRDTRNNPLWNPSNQKLANVEEDEAGRLKAFRRRFGRGWDAETKPEALEAKTKEEEAEEKRRVEERREAGEEEEGDNLMDLISGFGAGQKELTGTLKGRKK